MPNDHRVSNGEGASEGNSAAACLEHLEQALEHLRVCLDLLAGLHSGHATTRARAETPETPAVRVPVQRDPRVPLAHQTLSRREVKVAELMARGRSNQQIASALGLSLHTVKNHVAKILLKLDARSRTEATALLLGPGEFLQERADGRGADDSRPGSC